MKRNKGGTMKKFILGSLFIFSLVGCNEKYILSKDVIEKNQITYKIGDKIPYTGVVKYFYKNGNIKDEEISFY